MGSEMCIRDSGRELLAKDAAGRGLLLVLPFRLGGIDRSDGDSRDAKCGRGNGELHFVDFVSLTFHVALFDDVMLLDKVRQSRECSSKLSFSARSSSSACVYFSISLSLLENVAKKMVAANSYVSIKGGIDRPAN